MNTRIFLTLLSVIGILASGCVKDELYVDPNAKPDSEIVLLINEVASNNGDPNPDWMEIYNPGNTEIDISGFGVYDKPAALYKFPAGTKIAAKGYFVVVCDVALAGTDPTKYGAFGISSGGEAVFLVDATGAVIDDVTVGSETFANANPTKSAANSNTNEAPKLTASAITGLNDNSFYDYTVTAVDAGGMRDVKIYLEAAGEIKFTEMAPIGGGLYKYRIPVLPAGSVVKYYVVATDETGKKSYFPETAPTTPATITVADGLPSFVSVTPSNENPADGENIDFTVKAFDKSGVKEIRLYYTLNNALADTKLTVTLTKVDAETFTGTIPGQSDGTAIHYYLRAEDTGGQRVYFPAETKDAQGNVTSAFNHDVASTWPAINVAPLVILNALVINEIQASGAPWDFIELYNGTNAAIDISGYKVYDSGGLTVAYTIPNGTTIAAGGFFLIETGSGSPQSQFGISGSGEDIFLVNASDAEVDKLLKANWPGVPLVARKKDGAAKWVIPVAETKGTSNN